MASIDNYGIEFPIDIHYRMPLKSIRDHLTMDGVSSAIKLLLLLNNGVLITKDVLEVTTSLSILEEGILNISIGVSRMTSLQEVNFGIVG